MKPLVSVDELRKLMPHLSLGRAGQYAPLLSAAMEEQGITNKKRRCAFLAQLAHESVELRYMEEIASGSAYEGRSDLGNTQPGDGKRYKGRGPIQLTGRANYRRFGRLLGLDLEGQPTLAAQPENGFRIAALFWKLGGLNELADKLTLKKNDAGDKIVFAKITKIINGGHNGLQDRFKYFSVAKQVLHDDDPSSPQTPVAPPAVRPAESVHEQESAAESQAENSAIVSTEPGTDLLGAAVQSEKARNVFVRLFAKFGKQIPGFFIPIGVFLYEHKVVGGAILIVIAAAIVWAIYHNRKSLAKIAAKMLK